MKNQVIASSKGKNMNRKNENFAVKILESIDKKGSAHNLKDLRLGGCDIAKQGTKHLCAILIPKESISSKDLRREIRL